MLTAALSLATLEVFIRLTLDPDVEMRQHGMLVVIGTSRRNVHTAYYTVPIGIC